MNIALFAPILVDIYSNRIQFKPFGQSYFSYYYLDTGLYPSLLQLLTHLEETISPLGYSVVIVPDSEFGFKIKLSHALPFTLRFNAEHGCHQALGFEATEYNESTVVYSHQASVNSFIAPGVINDYSSFSNNSNKLVSALSGKSETNICGSKIRRKLRFTDLSTTLLKSLRSIFHSSGFDQSLLYFCENWDYSFDANGYSLFEKACLDISLQNELNPKRCYKEPNPPFYKADLFLEIK